MLTERRKQQKREYYQKNRKVIREKASIKQKLKLQDPVYKKEYCEKWRLYTRSNYESRLLASVKSKCKRLKIEFDLELSDITIPEYCPKTGIKLVVHTERGKYPDTPSIDRIDFTQKITFKLFHIGTILLN